MGGNTASYTPAQSIVSTPPPALRRARYIKAFLNVFIYIMDAAVLFAAFLAAYYARLRLPFFPRPDSVPSLSQYAGVVAVHILTIMFVFYLARLYHLPRTVSRIDLVRNLIGMVAVGTVLGYGISELFFEGTALEVDYPQSLFFYATVFSILFAFVGRELFRMMQVRLRRWNLATDNLLVVGEGSVADDIAKRIQQNPSLGYNMLGLVTKQGISNPELPEIPVIGQFEDLPLLIDRYHVEQVIIALPDARRIELVELISLCQRGQVDVKVYPDMLAYMSGDMNIDDLGGTPLITVRDIALRGWKLSLKRSVDIVGAFFGLIFLSPFMLLTALVIKLESEGPVFFTQERMGLDGKRFLMIKFRSMRVDAERNGPGWTVPGDTRVTPFGKFLRRSNWDEIPQLINVLLGEMSLVGPRPERPVYVEQFRENIPRYMERHREKAGMTGWAQVNGLRGDTSIAERTNFDLWYVENWSLWLDIKIIIRTIYQTLRRKSENAY